MSSRGELVGHTDAVWDLALVRDESTLVSCGAEGTVKVWDVSGPGAGSLLLSWGYSGLERESTEDEEGKDGPGATAIEAIKTDLKKVAVAYQNAVVKIFDIESGKEVLRLATDMTYGALPSILLWGRAEYGVQMARLRPKSIGWCHIRQCPLSSLLTRTNLFASLTSLPVRSDRDL